MFSFLKRGKRGVEWELGAIIIAVVVLVLLVFAVALLLNGKGGALLDSIKSALHFGKGVR
jgi:hypothetical protein